MPRRYEEHLIYRRLSNGACVMDRKCSDCCQPFIGERNICPACRNRKRREEGKFDKRYHRNYYRTFLSKAALLRRKGVLSKRKEIAGPRREAFKIQQQRIWAEIRAIKKAGLTVENTIEEIRQAGVDLLDWRFSIPDLHGRETANYAGLHRDD